MFYKLKKSCFIREYGDMGYITSTGIYNDQLFDISGKVFLNALSRTPLSEDELASNIASKFVGVTKEDILSDVIDFFDRLVVDGFVAKGETAEQCEHNDVGFKYQNNKTISSIEDFSPLKRRVDVAVQDLMKKQLLFEPKIGSFQIEITNKCNERCIHCYIPHEFKVNNMEPELYYNVLDQLQEMGVLNVTLSGGEPMVHPNFLEFLKAAKAKDFNVGVLTNLTLLNDDMIEVLKEGNPSFVQVSLYSMVPEKHDAITTVKGSFEKTKSAIEKLIENDVPVQISCPVMKTNKGDFVDVKKWANEHGIRATTDYSIMAEYNHDTSNLVYRLDLDETREVICGMLESDLDYQNELLNADFENEVEKLNNLENEAFCGVGISTCCMVANGDIFPCPGWQSMVCGNLYEKSLKEIWENSEKLNYLRNIRRKDMKECYQCGSKGFCSPCLARFANESKTGNPIEVAKHFCKVADINKAIAYEWIINHFEEKAIELYKGNDNNTAILQIKEKLLLIGIELTNKNCILDNISKIREILNGFECFVLYSFLKKDSSIMTELSLENKYKLLRKAVNM